MRGRHLAAYEGINGKIVDWKFCRFVQGVSSRFWIHHVFGFVAENLRTSHVRLCTNEFTSFEPDMWLRARK